MANRIREWYLDKYYPKVILGDLFYRMDRHWRQWECNIMSMLDFRYWFCECHYTVPFGKVISADCERHD